MIDFTVYTVEMNSLGSAFLGVYLSVCHPTAGLNLVAVQPPVLQLLLEQRPTHIGRVVQLSRPVVVQYLGENTRMSVHMKRKLENFKILTSNFQLVSILLSPHTMSPCVFFSCFSIISV